MRPDGSGRGPGRRAFVVGMAATFATRVAAAQPQRGPLPHRIGWISTETEADPFVDGFREGLRRHGYVGSIPVRAEDAAGSKGRQVD